ncbi:MAG: glycerol-3-phosphate dehydrogenase, partial [Lentisphaeria bacterium]|nr:glycerol-3-phosphate dehydrogenase [Lentisphaeria bacterium]
MSRPARDNGHHVRLVGTPLDRAIIDEARSTGRHGPLNRRLPEGLSYHQIEEVSAALTGADLVICGVSSFGLEWFAEAILPVLPLGVPVLSVTKGLLAQADGALVTYPHYFEARLPAAKQGRVLFNAIGGPCTSYELLDR